MYASSSPSSAEKGKENPAMEQDYHSDDDGSGVVSVDDCGESGAAESNRRRAATTCPATSIDQLGVGKCYEILFDRFDDDGGRLRRHRPSAPRGSMDDDDVDDDYVRDEGNDDDDESADFLKAYCDKNSLIFEML